jgi:hypothetical protein
MASFSFPEWLAIGGVAAVVVSLLVTSHASNDVDDDDNFREDVLMCEEAAAHLSSCCPGITYPDLKCRHRVFHEEDHGCTTSTVRHEETHPAIPLAESRCIRAMSCRELVDNDVCERARALKSITSGYVRSEDRPYTGDSGSTYDGGKSAPRPPVCP